MSHDHKAPVSGAFDYSERDLPYTVLTLWTVGTFVGLGAVLLFVYFVFGTPHSYPVADLVLTRSMNQPVLQSDGVKDLEVFQAEQEKTLTTYGWVDKAQGTVRVPIEKAIDMVLKKGLSARGPKQ